MRSLTLGKLVLVLMLLCCACVVFADDTNNLPDPDAVAQIMVRKNITKFPDTAKLVDAVSVSVQNGVAHLIGNLDTTKQAYDLIIIAEGTQGVQDVDVTELNIKDGSQLTHDQYVNALVIGTLIRDQVFGEKVDISNFPITIFTNLGITYLIGTVDYRYQLNNCINLSRGVKGVQRVISELNVRYYVIT